MAVVMKCDRCGKEMAHHDGETGRAWLYSGDGDLSHRYLNAKNKHVLPDLCTSCLVDLVERNTHFMENKFEN